MNLSEMPPSYVFGIVLDVRGHLKTIGLPPRLAYTIEGNHYHKSKMPLVDAMRRQSKSQCSQCSLCHVVVVNVFVVNVVVFDVNVVVFDVIIVVVIFIVVVIVIVVVTVIVAIVVVVVICCCVVLLMLLILLLLIFKHLHSSLYIHTPSHT